VKRKAQCDRESNAGRPAGGCPLASLGSPTRASADAQSANSTNARRQTTLLPYGRNLCQCEIRQTIGIVFSESELIDDKARYFAAHFFSAIYAGRKQIEHPVQRMCHQPDGI
jgi:hypothetical protein